MSFFPADFDPRDEVIAVLDLVEIDTTEGAYRFLIGTDGVFRDSAGNEWWGSALASVSGLESAINGVAPEGQIVMSFFQDPSMPDLIAEMKDQGVDYIAGQEIRFFLQPIRSQAEFRAPTTPPVQWMTRIMRQLTYTFSGAQNRQIGVSFETWAEHRKSARRIVLNTEGHEALTGSANPSLEFIPTVNFEEEKLFG